MHTQVSLPLTLEWLPWRASWQNEDHTLPPVVVGAAAAKRHRYIGHITKHIFGEQSYMETVSGHITLRYKKCLLTQDGGIAPLGNKLVQLNGI